MRLSHIIIENPHWACQKFVTLGQICVTLGQIFVTTTSGRFEHAIRCFNATKPYADIASTGTQGVRYNLMARLYYDSGDEKGVSSTIHSALEIAEHMKESIIGLANDFSLDDVLQEQASGYTELWKPEKAIEIYKETDRLRSFRPLRDQGAYIINKAQAYLQLEDLDQGIALALKGIQLSSRGQR